MIILEKISKSFGSKNLFEDVSLFFTKGNRYGLTGPNGAGKTTFFNIVTGKEEATSGTVKRPDRVGVLRQDIASFEEMKVLDVVIMGNKRLWEALQKREELEQLEITDEVGLLLGEVEGVIAEEDGYSAESNAEVLLSGMGIPENFFPLHMHSIPKDMQFRVLLCQSLFGDPEALLLDEPTNHLDLESIGWLETFLKSYKGTLVVISHDRHFLNAITTHIADIDYETIIVYPGNYDRMVEAKTEIRSRVEDEAKSKEKKIAQLREFVSKFGAGTRASQVQSRIKEIDRLQPQESKKTNIQRPYIRFYPTDKQAGTVVLKCENISKGYGKGDVVKNFNFDIFRGDKIGIIGNNGRGKSTLMGMLARALQPEKGAVQLGNQVLISYFPQDHGAIVSKTGNESAFEWLKERKPGIYDQDIRSVMGKMLFGGDDAFKKVATLSGGETARLIIAGMMLSEHNTVILDEPNNHLDLEAVSALGWALNEYKGTVVAVSHDRDLIASFAKKIIAFEEDGIHFFDGTLEDYLREKEEKKKASAKGKNKK